MSPDGNIPSPLHAPILDASFVMLRSTDHSIDNSPISPFSDVAPQQRSHPSVSSTYLPGSVASYAHDWTPSATGGLSTQGRNFIDGWGRICLPRGVNMSGASKLPANHNPDTFPHDHKTVTFVGRPFPLEEASEHFARLRRWGLTAVRFILTWEALEHAGPGQYDLEFLNYLHAILSLMPQFGLTAFLSVHQDVWSRYSGGSGAPAWTLEAAGFDLDKLETTGAAYLGGVRKPGEELERGRWPTGYQKLAASTMATCFWAGNDFAPKVTVQKDPLVPDSPLVNIQDFLQTAFLNCYDVLVRHVGALDAVLGFEVLNEPHRGYIQLPSLYGFDYNTDLHFHDVPSALESFALGAGHPTEVSHWVKSFPMPTRMSHRILRNEQGITVWKEDGPTSGNCIWAEHGVWGWDETKGQAVALRENYFTRHPETGKKVDWYTDYWYPFITQWSRRVRAIAGEHKVLFMEAIPNEFCPKSWSDTAHQPSNMVFAPHWYDLNALFWKEFGDLSINVQGLSRGMFLPRALYWGHQASRDNYKLQLRNIVEAAYRTLGERPVFIGECGIPMDMNAGEAFTSGNFVWQERMMDALLTGLEENLIGFTLWNFNPENTDIQGDYWCGENFSWFSRSRAVPGLKSLDQSEDLLDQGARLLPALVRPYPAKVAGIPLTFRYEMNKGEFYFEYSVNNHHANNKANTKPTAASISNPPIFSHSPILARETEIFIPSLLARGRQLLVQGIPEKNYRYDEFRQTLYVLHPDDGQHRRIKLSVAFDPPLTRRFELSTPLVIGWQWYLALVGLLTAVWMYHR